LWFLSAATEGGLRSVRLFADLGLAHEGGAFFDGKGAGGDVADEDGVALELAALLHGDVAFDLAENDDGAGFDLALDESVFTHGETAVRDDFAFDFAVDDEVVGELDGAFDFDVVARTFLLVVMTGAE
jgi:hypothetical protein